MCHKNPTSKEASSSTYNYIARIEFGHAIRTAVNCRDRKVENRLAMLMKLVAHQRRTYSWAFSVRIAAHNR